MNERIRNPNAYFVFTITAICSIGCMLLILMLPPKEQSLPNIVTITGTITTFGALSFTIREQLRLKTLTRAIRDNTRLIENDISNRMLDWNIEKGISCTEKLVSYSHDTRLTRLYDKLNDLSEHLLPCKKQASIHKGYISGECLETLLATRHEAVPKSMIRHQITQLKEQYARNRLAETELYIEVISSFMTSIVTGNYTRKTIESLPDFIATMNRIKHYFFEIGASPFQYSKP